MSRKGKEEKAKRALKGKKSRKRAFHLMDGAEKPLGPREKKKKRIHPQEKGGRRTA